MTARASRVSLILLTRLLWAFGMFWFTAHLTSLAWLSAREQKRRTTNRVNPHHTPALGYVSLLCDVCFVVSCLLDLLGTFRLVKLLLGICRLFGYGNPFVI